MYRILRGEMVKANISIPALAEKMGVTEKTLRNKLNGKTDFTWPEAKAVKRIVNPEMEMDDLFKTDETKTETEVV